MPFPSFIPVKISEKKAYQKCAAVRKAGRFPTVTYVHNKKGVNKNKPKGYGCAIFRSAEPTSDLIGHRYTDDEEMIRELARVY